ncbi:Spaetzle [Popillia japonica]|uniref:Spaetzle n=1 Tax=Popillia japonica TaxID=7064 RepID=A0AAW1J0U4_POPJA
MCNETDNYPEAEIRKLLKKYPIYKKLFGTVTQLFHKIASKPQSFQLDEEGEKEEHNNICPTQTFYVVPQKAKDVDGNWQHVVNGINMTQMVIYETCAEGATCHSDCHVTGHTVACRTQGLIFKMLVLSQTPGKESDLELKSFSVPIELDLTDLYHLWCSGQNRLINKPKLVQIFKPNPQIPFGLFSPRMMIWEMDSAEGDEEVKERENS